MRRPPCILSCAGMLSNQCNRWRESGQLVGPGRLHEELSKATCIYLGHWAARAALGAAACCEALCIRPLLPLIASSSAHLGADAPQGPAARTRLRLLRAHSRRPEPAGGPIRQERRCINVLALAERRQRRRLPAPPPPLPLPPPPLQPLERAARSHSPCPSAPLAAAAAQAGDFFRVQSLVTRNPTALNDDGCGGACSSLGHARAVVCQCSLACLLHGQCCSLHRPLTFWCCWLQLQAPAATRH